MSEDTPRTNDSDSHRPADPESTADNLSPPSAAPAPGSHASSISDNALTLVRGLPNGAPEEVEAQMQEDLATGLPDGTLLPGGRAEKRFRVLKQCGHGGMGTVYKALDLLTQEFAAIKVVFQADASAAAVQRHLEEAETAAGLDRELTACVYDRGLEPGYAWFAMDFLEGPTLDREILEKGPLSWERARQVCRCVLAGLRDAHARGRVHCDLKPANVMQAGGKDTWKIVDWGLARLRSPHTGMAVERTISGTREYLAPECWDGQYSPQSDFYAVGLMLVEMLTGRRLFSSEQPVLEVRRAHREVDFAAYLTGVPGLPDHALPVARRATAKRRRKRYPDAAAFLQALDPPAQPPGAPKRRIILALAAVLLLALAAGLGWWFYPPAPVPHYKGELDVWVVAEGEIRRSKPAAVGGPGARLPLAVGTGVVVQGKLAEGPPAYCYVIWVRSDGKPDRVYPEGWTADQLPATETQQREFRWPKQQWVSLKPKADGVEVVLWLVRPQRLTRSDNTRLNALLDGLQWRQPEKWKGKEIALWWDNGNLMKAGERTGVEPPLGAPDDPISQTEKLLQAVKDQGLAPYSVAFAYSCTGR